MILVDIYEPDEILKLIEQSAPVTKLPLNQAHRSDYYFGGEDSKTRQFSRKQSDEILGNLDEAEDQLRDYYNNADENSQVIEGLITSVPLMVSRKTDKSISIRKQFQTGHGGLFSYKISESGFIYDETAWPITSTMFDAWLFRLEQAGITTYFTENYIRTAKLLVAIYRNCQKPPEEHETLQRYIRPRITIKEHDPFVKAMISLSSIYKLGIGEKTAVKIAKKYSSLLDLAMAEVNEICQVEGIGKSTAEKILTCIGRELDG